MTNDDNDDDDDDDDDDDNDNNDYDDDDERRRRRRTTTTTPKDSAANRRRYYSQCAYSAFRAIPATVVIGRYRTSLKWKNKTELWYIHGHTMSPHERRIT